MKKGTFKIKDPVERIERRKNMLKKSQAIWKLLNKDKMTITRKKYFSYWTSDKYRNKKLKDKYGIDLEQYNEMLIKQNGVCAICLKPEIRKSNRNKRNIVDSLGVDHNHISGKIRKLLCFRCNTAIGKFEDKIELLQNAIKYLEENS